MDAGFNPLLAFGWSVLCGFVMSMGAGGGGILAGVGHLSILGIADANMIKVANQILEFSSRLVAVPLYLRQQRVVGSVALAFGIGAPAGAIAGSWISKQYLEDVAVYRVWFGLFLVLIALHALRATFKRVERTQHNTPHVRTASEAVYGDGVRTVEWRWRVCRVRFGNRSLAFSPIAAALGGFAISFIGALLGVGGGFLVTPFIAGVLLFPMYLALGTGLVALIIPLVVSVLTYFLLHVKMNWLLMAVEVPGVLAGSFLGPMLNRYMNEKLLKSFVAMVLLAIGVYYVLGSR